MKRKHRKQLRIVAVCIAAAAVLTGIGLLAKYIYNHVDHAAGLDEADISAYNTAITAAARSNGTIAADEFVIIDTISKNSGGNTDVAIRVYKLPEGASDADYAGLRVCDLPEDFAPERMATGTARLIKDSLEKIVVTVNYIR